jgi:hypothetical protein
MFSCRMFVEANHFSCCNSSKVLVGVIVPDVFYM